jgi:hypothetical protein
MPLLLEISESKFWTGGVDLIVSDLGRSMAGHYRKSTKAQDLNAE